nr:bZIP transcription factor [Aspergillus muricatus]
MDDTLLSTEIPSDWTDMLSQLDGSTPQFDTLTPRAFEQDGPFTTSLGQPNGLSYQTTMSQFDELDRSLGLHSSGAGNDTSDPSTFSSNAQDTSCLRPNTASTNQEQSDTSAQPSLAEAQPPSNEPRGTFEKSVEVKQLRQKYHEKYKERNRLAAGKSRQKQVDLIALLEAERRDEERRRQALEGEIQQIQKELYAIKQELHSHIRVSNCINMMSQGARLQTLGLLAQDILR